MSCVFALALPALNFVVADTRINMTAEGRTSWNDEASYDFVYPDGHEERVGPSYRKLRRTNFGWVAGAGAFLLINPLLGQLEQLTEPARVPATVDAVFERQMNYLQTAAPQFVATLNQTFILYTYLDKQGFQLRGYDLRTRNGLPDGSQYVVSAPPDFPADINTSIHDRIKTELSHTGTEAAIAQNIRVMSTIFHTVHLHAPSVSDIIEIGITQRDRRGVTNRYLRAHNVQIEAGTNSQIAGSLQLA